MVAEFLRHRVNDGGLLQLIDKWLKAGVALENGLVTLVKKMGAPGWSGHPWCWRTCTHYVLDLWFEKRFKKSCQWTGCMGDFVVAFQDHGQEHFGGKWKSGGGLQAARRAPEDNCAALTGSLLHQDQMTGHQTGDLYLPWFQRHNPKTRRGTVAPGRTASIKAEAISSAAKPMAG